MPVGSDLENMQCVFTPVIHYYAVFIWRITQQQIDFSQPLWSQNRCVCKSAQTDVAIAFLHVFVDLCGFVHLMNNFSWTASWNSLKWFKIICTNHYRSLLNVQTVWPLASADCIKQARTKLCRLLSYTWSTSREWNLPWSAVEHWKNWRYDHWLQKTTTDNN